MSISVSIIDKNTMIVENVIAVCDSACTSGSGTSEENIISFSHKLCNDDDLCIHVLTYREGKKHHGGIGFIYDESLDDFYPPQPEVDYVLDEETLTWKPPIPKPERTQEQIDNNQYWSWNPIDKEWVLHSGDAVLLPWDL